MAKVHVKFYSDPLLVPGGMKLEKSIDKLKFSSCSAHPFRCDLFIEIKEPLANGKITDMTDIWQFYNTVYTGNSNNTFFKIQNVL